MTDRDSAYAMAYLAVALSVLQTAFRGIGIGASAVALLSLGLSFFWDTSAAGPICSVVGSVFLIASWVTARVILKTARQLNRITGNASSDRG